MATIGLGPFPLQTNLRRLKPNLTRLLPIIAGGAVFLGNKELLEKASRFFSTPEGWVVAGLLLAVILFLLADLFLKQIHYNDRGVGIINPIRGQSVWYGFEELKDGRFSLRKTRAKTGSGLMLPTGTMVLHFHTGSVRLWPGLYDNKGMAEFTGILSRRFPGRFAALALKETDEEKKARETTEKGNRDNERKRRRDERRRKKSVNPTNAPGSIPGLSSRKKKTPW